MHLPKISAPLAKSIRTGEGILIYVTSLVLAIASVLPHGLSWTKSGLYVTILGVANVISRSILKAVAVQKDVGIDAPIPFDPADPAVVAGVVTDIAGSGVLGGAGDPAHADVSAQPETAVTPDPPKA